MDDFKKFKKELQKINGAIFNIIEYYTCPPDCHAFCCKVCPVDLTEKEYGILRKLSREKTDKSKIVIYQGGTKNHQLDNPCSFLDTDELCTVHSKRPTVCHIYPFSMAETFPSAMQIYPCIMGVKISKRLS